ncbi:hypothetical protein [Nannocystis pusilla]|uniref:Uncharacterized protein n=1 Tax=Nannocystis pusilla TaxID=889268 RepID=A0ABS7U1S1_9BACT|nr:hypothetical protein [Nannocystis pusilla]MBZ5714381.1 hypothetical protein [Nannocystis pusilla]
MIKAGASRSGPQASLVNLQPRPRETVVPAQEARDSSSLPMVIHRKLSSSLEDHG